MVVGAERAGQPKRRSRRLHVAVEIADRHDALGRRVAKRRIVDDGTRLATRGGSGFRSGTRFASPYHDGERGHKTESGRTAGHRLEDKSTRSSRDALAVNHERPAAYRSLRAHERVGFEPIHRYRDGVDEWVIVAWDWSKRASRA